MGGGGDLFSGEEGTISLIFFVIITCSIGCGSILSLVQILFSFVSGYGNI